MTRHHQQLLRLTQTALQLFVALGISFNLLAPVAYAANETSSIDFQRDVQPILARKCYSCHGPGHAESGLRLHNQEGAFAETDSGIKVILPGKANDSELLKRVTSSDADTRMPPSGKPLTEKEITTLRTWIDTGAKWDEHWAFAQRTTPEVPRVQNQAWVANPIDAFILSKLEARKLTPAAPATKTAWLRRATYDLLGLPPKQTEIDDFLADNSPQAYERVVDRLLASPHYGERWGRHWLDIVRFAETNSFERDGLKPNAWRYRDYVIRSLNEDKPYDQFVREQLHGDEMPEHTPDQLIATGYYRLGLWDDEPADRVQARYDELDDIVSNVSQVFLGLTVNCARCHDHKIDPITQKDYYAMMAAFHEITSYGSNGDQPGQSQFTVPDPDNAKNIASWEAELKDLREKIASYEEIARQRQPESEKSSDKELVGKKGKQLPAKEALALRELRSDAKDKRVRDRVAELLEKPDRERYLKHFKDHEDLERRGANIARALAVTTTKNPPKTHVFARGNPHVPGVEVEAAIPSLFGGKKLVFTAAKKPENTTGQRTALADWIVDPDNRLTARVIANRIWQHHFGRGIVRSPNNFGMLGTPPTHPELLDWLAGELINGGWRFKSLHRTIMLSNAYRMSSEANPAALASDPDNDLFWRFDLRRLSGEELRDTLYTITGEFNPEMYGPGIYPTISKEVLAGQSVPGKGWGKSSPQEQARRSIYIHVKRSLVTPLLSTFDFPETDASCEARFVTTQPGQMLSLMNGEFAHERAAKLAERVQKEAGDDRAKQLRSAIRITFQREATDAEQKRGLAFMQELHDKHGQSPSQALQLYCLSLFNRNELLYVD
jgi:mono/diheme cytochrome c family protein